MVKISELAAQKIKEMQITQNKENSFLRISLADEGGNVLKFGMTLEESYTEDDILTVEYGVSIVTDIELATTLEGTILDYNDPKDGGGFAIRKIRPDHAESCSGKCGKCDQCC